MKIETSYPNNYKTTSTNHKKDRLTEEQEVKKDHYEAGSVEQKVTYSKPTSTGQISIEQLKKESEKAYENLRRIVKEMLQKQRTASGQEKLSDSALEEAMAKYVTPAEDLQMEPAQLIADDGPLGAEAVSQKIVDFAIAISGGDKTKLDTLRSAIDEGFNQVKDMFGSLPEVSERTHTLVMEKLSKWENE